MFPYSRYLRALDLRDLESLLEDDRFRGKIEKTFFAGKLQEFYFTQVVRGKYRHIRLDIRKIVLALGSKITHHATLLESLSESANVDILAEALVDWAPRLNHLTQLEFGDGKALADENVRNLLHVNCPLLDTLRIFISSNEVCTIARLPASHRIGANADVERAPTRRLLPYIFKNKRRYSKASSPPSVPF